MKFPWVIMRRSDLEVQWAKAHHNVGLVHQRCGAQAVADAWGKVCPVCDQVSHDRDAERQR